ncbi:MAG: hypothetical protein KBC94_23155 [Pseudacidovorax sp.]|uniref:hypothetical protein n=1 Tax=Pseudacidovorax sp. TaxID=1934311 RepID=UPI001B6AF65D|nr:hypothetical protein [Pseudacidovorax sp.]MBP6897325.1 hypothetical protein [Pseudacidovorax sp.]
MKLLVAMNLVFTGAEMREDVVAAYMMALGRPNDAALTAVIVEWLRTGTRMPLPSELLSLLNSYRPPTTPELEACGGVLQRRDAHG